MQHILQVAYPFAFCLNVATGRGDAAEQDADRNGEDGGEDAKDGTAGRR
eukprot:SAG22_NODE_20856_length_262_cov_0.631902_1_plen_48_part_10